MGDRGSLLGSAAHQAMREIVQQARNELGRLSTELLRRGSEAAAAQVQRLHGALGKALEEELGGLPEEAARAPAEPPLGPPSTLRYTPREPAQPRLEKVRTITAIEVEFVRGYGSEDDPVRQTREYWTVEGKRLTVHDAWAESQALGGDGDGR